MFITICLQKLISSGTAFNSFRFIGACLTIILGSLILQPGHLFVIKMGGGGCGAGVCYLMIPESCECPGITGITPR